MDKSDVITIIIPGMLRGSIRAGNLPPVGTRIEVHKHLTKDGAPLAVEVTAHEWQVIQVASRSSKGQDKDEDKNRVCINVRTRPVTK